MSDETKITPAVDDYAAIARRMAELKGSAPKGRAAPAAPVYNNIEEVEPQQLIRHHKPPVKPGRF